VQQDVFSKADAVSLHYTFFGKTSKSKIKKVITIISTTNFKKVEFDRFKNIFSIKEKK
jgi:hypothetical protein